MKKIIYGSLVVVVLIILGLAILDSNSKKEVVPAPVQGQTEANPQIHTVKVLESINTSGYTYIKVSENGTEYWIAVNKMDVKKDQALYFSKSMEMKNFKSTELNRTFETVLFVEGITTIEEVLREIIKIRDEKTVKDIITEMKKYCQTNYEDLTHIEKWAHMAVQMPCDIGGRKKNEIKKFLISKASGRVLETMCGFNSYFENSENIIQSKCLIAPLKKLFIKNHICNI